MEAPEEAGAQGLGSPALPWRWRPPMGLCGATGQTRGLQRAAVGDEVYGNLSVCVDRSGLLEGGTAIGMKFLSIDLFLSVLSGFPLNESVRPRAARLKGGCVVSECGRRREGVTVEAPATTTINGRTKGNDVDDGFEYSRQKAFPNGYNGTTLQMAAAIVHRL